MIEKTRENKGGSLGRPVIIQALSALSRLLKTQHPHLCRPKHAFPVKTAHRIARRNNLPKPASSQLHGCFLILAIRGGIQTFRASRGRVGPPWLPEGSWIPFSACGEGSGMRLVSIFERVFEGEEEVDEEVNESSAQQADREVPRGVLRRPFLDTSSRTVYTHKVSVGGTQ